MWVILYDQGDRSSEELKIFLRLLAWLLLRAGVHNECSKGLDGVANQDYSTHMQATQPRKGEHWRQTGRVPVIYIGMQFAIANCMPI